MQRWSRNRQRQSGQIGAQRVDAQSGLAAGGQNIGQRRRMFARQRLNLGLLAGKLRGFDGIGLCQHQPIQHGRLIEQVQCCDVVVLDLDTRIEQHKHPLQAGPPAQIFEHQPLPILFHRNRRLGVSIARHIDQRETIAEVEEIQLLRPPGLRRHPRQSLSAGDGVDDGRFAHIRPTGKCHLRQTRRRQLVQALGCEIEVATAREQQPPCFQGGFMFGGFLLRRFAEAVAPDFACLGGDQDFTLAADRRVRRMMNDCCKMVSVLFQLQ